MRRRDLLKFGAAVWLCGPASALPNPTPARLLSCFRHSEQHYLGLLDVTGEVYWQIALPDRGHGMTLDPQHDQVAVFARRPGRYVWLVSVQDGQVRARIEAQPERHFYGHGLFSNDGQTLFCSENDFSKARGVIGIYQQTLQGWERAGEFASAGVGPHQLAWLADRQTMVVANGGIQTHPDVPRVKQNLDSMQPNLAYLDSSNGRLLGKHQPPAQWHQLSIRHIDVAPDDTVAVGMQFQGDPRASAPVIATHFGNQELNFLSIPSEVQAELRNYCGSVRFRQDGEQFAVSSPRGGAVTLWSKQGAYLSSHTQKDVCGIARADNRFVFSDGLGRIQADSIATSARTHLRWDNHLLEV